MTQRADTRQQILDTAAELVCEAAGVSKGSFFHFFPSKRDLALAVMDQFAEQIGQTLVAKSFSPKYPPLERLDRFVKELYTFQKRLTKDCGHLPGCPFGNLAMEQATLDEVLRKKADRMLRGLAEHIQEAVADAVRSGDLPPLDQAATADAMLSYIEGIQLMAKARNDPELIRRLGSAVKSIRVP